MAKDPAFLFYPNDYIGGTMGMTFEQKGAYMELLMMQFNRGHMTSHMVGQTVGQLWDNIKDKFAQDSKGLWYNVRLEEEKLKRQNYSNSRKNNILGINQHSKKPKKEGGHMTGHMEDVNVNEIIDYLNKVSGKNFRVVNKNIAVIKARLNEGYAFDDFKTVIDKKVKEWMGTVNDLYIRPETLFSNKFDGYLNQTVKKDDDKYRNDDVEKYTDTI